MPGGPTRRGIALAVAAAALAAVPPLGDRPAQAAVSATLVVPCQPPGDSCWPAAFTFTPNRKHLFYLERFTGRIHRVNLATGADGLWGDVGDPAGGSEQGGLGIAVDPRWNRRAKSRKARRRRARSRWVYAFYTHQAPLENRVVRMRKRPNDPGFVTEHLVSIPINTGTNHNGGPIRFGPDGKLYVATGDQAQPARAQDLADPAGKILRLNGNGSIPSDNPIAGSRAYSVGHRNSFGFDFDPQTGRLWQSENGPDCDEINLVLAGRNHGWGPGADCPDMSTEGPSPVPAEREYSPVIVPTGLSFCVGCGLGTEFEGDLLLAMFGDGTQIRALSLDGERDDLVDEQVLYDHPSGVVALERRPNGQVFFSDHQGIYRLGPG